MGGSLTYYSSLAWRMPGALALGAARRVQGVARRALYQRRMPLQPSQLLQALGGLGPGELAARVLEQRSGHAWCEPSRRDSVLQALAYLPEARKRALARARAALRGELHLFGMPVQLGERQPVDWALDRLSGERYPLESVERLPLLRPGLDPKYPWALGRLDWLVALGQGWWLEQDEAYAHAFVSRAMDFLQANPPGQGVQWASPMEVSLRAANLAQALVLLAQAPPVRQPEFLTLLLTSLAEHSAFVQAWREDGGLVPNNHLVAADVGLLVVGCLFPLLPGAQAQARRAARALCNHMHEQVHPEGTSFEGSVPYHRLAMELFTLALLVARGSGLSLGEPYAARLHRMYAAARTWCSHSGLAPQVGDTDSGRALALTERGPCEQGWLAPLGAALFADSALAEGPFPDEALWLLGMEGLRTWQSLPPAPPAASATFPAAGLHVLRGAGAVVTVSAGSQGQRGVGGHSHNDKLSFELHLHGRPLIVDPGTGTYTREPALRQALRSTAAHNTLQVDGAEQSPLPEERLFALPEAARARVLAFHTGPSRDWLTACHEGYRPVTLERTLVLDRCARALAGVDRLQGPGLHTVVGRLHLPHEQAWLAPPPPEVRARALSVPEAPQALEPLAVALGPREAPVAWVLAAQGLRPTLEPSRYSPGYGCVVPARAIVFRERLPLPVWLRWLVVFA